MKILKNGNRESVVVNHDQYMNALVASLKLAECGIKRRVYLVGQEVAARHWLVSEPFEGEADLQPGTILLAAP